MRNIHFYTRQSLKVFLLLNLLMITVLANATGTGPREMDGGACSGQNAPEGTKECQLYDGDVYKFSVKSDYNGGACNQKVTISINGGCTMSGSTQDGGNNLCQSAKIQNREVKFVPTENNPGCTVTLTAGADSNSTKTWVENWTLIKVDQTISASSLPSPLTYGESHTLSATSTSGLPVNIAASGSCSGGGQSPANISISSGVGTCTVTFSQNGNYKYNAATNVVRVGAVQKADQVLEVQSPSFPIGENSASPADIISAQAIAYTGGTQHGVNIIASGPSCNASGESPLAVPSIGLGECVITYTSKANTNNYHAKSATRTFEFIASPQVIEITQLAPAEVYALDEFTVAAVADSGEPVSIEVMGDGCEPAQSDNGTLTIQTKEAGLECVIIYTRDEVPPEYEAAEPREQRVTTIKQQQAIIVEQPSFAEPNSVIELEAELLHSKVEGGANITISSNIGCEITHQENDEEGRIFAEVRMASSGVCFIYYETPETAKYEAAGAQAKTKIVVKNNDSDVSGIWTSAVLVTAKDDNGKAQPITAAPMVSRSRKISGSYPNTIVMFGTGQYIYEEDLVNQDMQSLYVVQDRGTTDIVRNAKVSDAEDNQFDMLERREFSYHILDNQVHRKVKGDRDNTEGELGEIFAADPVNWNTQFGWYVDLDGANLGEGEGAERSVFRPIVVGDVLMLSTLIPQIEMSCASESKGVFISMNWTSGFAPQSPSYDVNGDGILSSADKGFVGSLSSSLSQVSYFNENALFTKDNEIVINKVDPASSTSDGGYRVGWEEKQAHGIISQ